MAIVYRFRTWDITNDGYRDSQRWATLEAIEKICGEAFGEGVELGGSLVGQEIPGMTARDFNPHNISTGNFPTGRR